MAKIRHIARKTADTRAVADISISSRSGGGPWKTAPST
jgi:hypothetical protein